MKNNILTNLMFIFYLCKKNMPFFLYEMLCRAAPYLDLGTVAQHSMVKALGCAAAEGSLAQHIPSFDSCWADLARSMWSTCHDGPRLWFFSAHDRRIADF